MPFPFARAWAITAAMDSPVPLHSHDLAPLLDRVAAGDRAALSDLYRRTSAKLYGICARLLGSNADAEDVLQDVYVTVWRKADRFDAAKASPITWLAVIARNKAIDRLRARRLPTAQLDAAGDIADDSASAFELVDQAREQRRVAECLEQLDDKPRAMIRAAFLDGATYPELATREAVPLGTMKSWIRRGLLSLRKCLER
ncbi:sigma-70 family RNA polymerase sigma factor [Sphingomonas sp.]|uniref:sigma-70 family RNA polymerase sigma factor n=1 Tax=Sphingomonas sp. TaxID=28214 RepID=UPI00286E843F|nr:sigma-70 family RNA polymerase sigma factor [Sphingomonas sp.]